MAITAARLGGIQNHNHLLFFAIPVLLITGLGVTQQVAKIPEGYQEENARQVFNESDHAKMSLASREAPR